MLFCNVYGQKWHLNRVDKSSKFKYEYWFHFENEDDSSSYIFKKNKGKSISKIQLTDNKGDSIDFAFICIKDFGNDTTYKILTDFDGLGQLKLMPGRYSMEILAVNYDKFSLDFSILENEFFDLNVKLGLASELEIYQINSKTVLNEGEILEVMKCVKENRKDYYKKCSDNKKFYVKMHI